MFAKRTPDAKRPLYDGTHKFLGISSGSINHQMRQVTSSVAPSAALATTAIQTSSGFIDVFLPSTINRASSIVLGFKINNNSSTTRTAQVITISPYLNTTAAAATADDSNYHIASKTLGMTTVLAFGDAASVIQTAIRALGDRYASVTVSGTMVTTVLISMIGIDSTTSPELIGIPAGINQGNVGIVFSSTISTAFSFGDECRLVPGAILLADVETLINDKVISSISGLHLHAKIETLLDSDTRSRVALGCHFDPSTGLSDSVIVPGSSLQYYVPLLIAVSSRELPIKNLPANGRINLRVRFDYGSKLLESSSSSGTGITYQPSTGLITDLTVSDLEVIVSGSEFKQTEDLAEKWTLARVAHDYRYHHSSFAVLDDTAYTGGVSQRRLFNLTGYLSHLYIYPVIANGSGTSLYTPQRLQSLEIEDSAGRSLSGNWMATELYWRSIGSTLRFPSNTWINTNSIPFWSPSKDPLASMQFGANHGTYKLTSREQLRFAVKTSATLRIYIMASTLGYVKLRPDGVVEVELT